MTPAPMLTTREAMALLRVSKTFMSENAAQLGAVKVGTRLRFPREALESYLAGRRVQSRQPAPLAAPLPIQAAVARLERRGVLVSEPKPEGWISL